MAKLVWIKEAEAADRLGVKPRTLRRMAKARRWIINYTAPLGRRFQYLEKDIDKVLLENSTITK